MLDHAEDAERQLDREERETKSCLEDTRDGIVLGRTQKAPLTYAATGGHRAVSKLRCK